MTPPLHVPYNRLHPGLLCNLIESVLQSVPVAIVMGAFFSWEAFFSPIGDEIDFNFDPDDATLICPFLP